MNGLVLWRVHSLIYLICLLGAIGNDIFVEFIRIELMRVYSYRVL